MTDARTLAYINMYAIFGTLENCESVLRELQHQFGEENVVRRG